MNQPNPAISYLQESDQDFVDSLAKIAWVENSELAGITLIQPCPHAVTRTGSTFSCPSTPRCGRVQPRPPGSSSSASAPRITRTVPRIQRDAVAGE